jgi:hypothetical protein
MINKLRTLFLLEAAFCFLFFYFSNGLGYLDSQRGAFIQIKSLYSSGSEDDISIFLLGAISLLIFLILIIKKYSLTGINLIVGIGVVFQLFSLVLMQVSSIFDTIIFGHDYYLLFIVIFQIGIIVVTIFYNAIGTK